MYLSLRLRRAVLGLMMSLGTWLALEALVLGVFDEELQAWQAPPASPQDGAPVMLGNPYLLWEFAPGRRKEAGALVEINSLGLRGPEPAIPRPSGVRRFITLGDSSPFGFGVAEEEVFSRVAAAALGPGVEAINGCTPGYSSSQSLNLLRMRLLPLEPELLVVANLWSDNNFDSFVDQDVLTAWRSYDRSPAGRLRRLLSESAIFRLLDWKLRVEGKAQHNLEVGWMLHRDFHVGPRRVDIDRYAQNLDEIVALARGADAEVVFLLLPNEEDVPRPQGDPGAAWDPYRRVMRETAARHGAPLIDAPALFQDSGLADPALFLDQMHPTATGHRLLGEALAELLAQAGWAQGGRLMSAGTGAARPDYVDPYVEGDAARPAGAGPEAAQPVTAGTTLLQATIRSAQAIEGSLQVDVVDDSDPKAEPTVLATTRLSAPGPFAIEVPTDRRLRLRVCLDRAGDGPGAEDPTVELGSFDPAAPGATPLVFDLDAAGVLPTP